jgi:uncharacterized protein YegJ (DUF2314 family)
MKKLLTILLICTAFAAKAVDTPHQPCAVKAIDTTFVGLKDTAQKNISRFITALTKNPRGYRFLIKSEFVGNGKHEHLWSQVKVYNNGIFKGTFIDSPFELTNIKTGDKIAIRKSAVEDWAVFDRKGLRVDGNYSDKYEKMQKL